MRRRPEPYVDESDLLPGISPERAAVYRDQYATSLRSRSRGRAGEMADRAVGAIWCAAEGLAQARLWRELEDRCQEEGRAPTAEEYEEARPDEHEVADLIERANDLIRSIVGG